LRSRKTYGSTVILILGANLGYAAATIGCMSLPMLETAHSTLGIGFMPVLSSIFTFIILFITTVCLSPSYGTLPTNN